MSLAWAGDLQIWAALLTLTAIEIVLGIDNVILVSVLANRLAQHRQAQARRLGLILAWRQGWRYWPASCGSPADGTRA